MERLPRTLGLALIFMAASVAGHTAIRDAIAADPPPPTPDYRMTWRVTRAGSVDFSCMDATHVTQQTGSTEGSWEGAVDFTADGTVLAFASTGELHATSVSETVFSCGGTSRFYYISSYVFGGQPTKNLYVDEFTFGGVRYLADPFDATEMSFGPGSGHSEDWQTGSCGAPASAPYVTDSTGYFGYGLWAPIGSIPWDPCLGTFHKHSEEFSTTFPMCAPPATRGPVSQTMVDTWDVTVVPTNGSPLPDIAVSYRRTMTSPASETVRAVCADGTSTAVVWLNGLPVDIKLDEVQVEVASPFDGSIRDDLIVEGAVARVTYQPPESFLATEDDFTRAQRDVGIRVTVRGCEIPTPRLTLMRPPVVMFHGLWSDASTWKALRQTLARAGYPSSLVVAAQYANARHLSEQSLVLHNWISIALRNARDDRIVAQRADVVAHSMGGLVVTRYGGAESDRVHSFVSVGTPYLGSEAANYLLSLPSESTAFILRKLGRPIDQGAVEDMRHGGGGVYSFADAVGVPTRALAGIANRSGYVGSCWLPDLFLATYTAQHPFKAQTLGFADMHEILFGDQDTDWIVSESSQTFGATDFRTCPVVDHCEETSDPCAIAEIAEFLNLSRSVGPTKAATPATKSATQRVPRRTSPPTKRIATPARFSIEEPQDGVARVPGSVVDVAVSPERTAKAVLVLTSTGESAVATTEPYEWQFKIPDDAAGAWTVVAVEFRHDGTIDADARAVAIEQGAVLTGLEVLPDVDPVYLTPGVIVPLRVRGTFSDGVDRDVTSPAAGTTYASNAPGVAQVNAEGEIRTVSLGTATVTVANNGLISSVHVEAPVSLDTRIGTIGSSLHLSGAGFGARRGRVLVGGKACHVVSWTDSDVDCIVRHARGLGSVDVEVRPRKSNDAGAMVFKAAFTPSAPFFDEAPPRHARAGVELTLDGWYFGRRRGKLILQDRTLHQRRARAVTWSMDPVTGVSRATVRIPSLVSAGTYDLVLVNTIGETRTQLTIDP